MHIEKMARRGTAVPSMAGIDWGLDILYHRKEYRNVEREIHLEVKLQEAEYQSIHQSPVLPEKDLGSPTWILYRLSVNFNNVPFVYNLISNSKMRTFNDDTEALVFALHTECSIPPCHIAHGCDFMSQTRVA